MPSDVHIEQTPIASYKSANLLSSFKGSPMDADAKTTTVHDHHHHHHHQNHHNPHQNESVYLQRYKALRDAGFDESIANKYSPIYSSVNEVIDAILSQSLSDNLSINPNESYPTLFSHNNDETIQESMARNGNSSQSSTVQSNKSSVRSPDINCENLLMLSALTEQLGLSAPQKLAESKQQRLFDRSIIDCNDHHARIMFNTNKQTCFQSNYNYYPSNGKILGDRIDQAGNESGNNSNNLILSMLKDGLLEDSNDEITLEDDALVEPNANSSSSPSASSSLSSGVSSFFMDTSSSPSSFSSLSSSISITPPNLPNNHHNSNNNSTNDDGSTINDGQLVGLFLTKPNNVPTSVATTSTATVTNKTNDVGYLHNGIIETNDLICETLDKLSSPMQSNHSATIISTNHNNIHNKDNDPDGTKPFINGGGCDGGQQSSTTPLMFAATRLNQFAKQNLNPSDLTSNGNNNGKNHLHYDDNGTSFDTGEICNLQFTNIDKVDLFNNLDQTQPLFDLENCLMMKNANVGENDNHEDGTLNDLLGYLNLHQCQQSFLNFDRNICNNDNGIISGFGGDNRDPSKNHSNELMFDENGILGEMNKNNYHHQNLFSDNNQTESIFNVCSNDSEQNHHPYNHSSSFLNQPRTFADIAAASTLLSNGSSDDTFIGLLDSSKSNNLAAIPANGSISNGAGGGGFFANTFANNLPTMNGNNTNNGVQSFYEQYDQNGLNRKFYRKQQQLNFRSTASPLSTVNEKNIKGPTKDQHPQQVNFICSAVGSMRTNHNNNLNMSLDGTHSTNDNGIESSFAINGGFNNGNNHQPSSPANNSNNNNRPTNLMGYKGLWVCNVSPNVGLHYLKRRFRRFGHFTGIQTFERRATNGTNIVFVHYDNPYSPVEAISSLHGYNGQDLCADQNEPLKLRFAPSMEQSRSVQLPTLEQARKIVEKSGECFNWRLSSGCHRGVRCQLKHVPINKEIDSQPWVKALKKKINEA